ncbi:2-oxoacid:acceptor oxidoreductase family protein [Anaerotignum lactatifermentans]|uniref:2-oxoacid:acceptor oxidoreductase family protein n=1 Tax=Anaerotignum lactatifermentans TaxID=160404 RepID=A0ABS2G7Q7_9FIRM|nr:2-oxoacid:acceptor oxidoreductase family protein [Anaerotignum lactatifermentans]MBM6828210.1 2-oxoacid:acceptor oxidoreductase family protein [Anaerotignum lactatifermentans]MBM6876627.1 2-oxoacid:acceptor oxidoreductase family protein [Anaerotignum lactatifermentans]MBM6949793.1 2-oxoacid:acceptor oxidoreductase family protein [Anaerotignum lactatifermentans]
MSTFSSIIAGFGGQGSLLMGKIMAYSGMLEGKEVSWCPSYGPEMRGGTANVNVIISDEGIGSPVITKDADCIVALNQPSLDKFAPVVRVGGSLVINADLCSMDHVEAKEGVKVFEIPANRIATDAFGGSKLANLVMLGAVVFATGAIKQDGMDDTFAHVFEGGKAKFIPDNKKAFELGFNYAKEHC